MFPTLLPQALSTQDTGPKECWIRCAFMSHNTVMNSFDMTYRAASELFMLFSAKPYKWSLFHNSPLLGRMLLIWLYMQTSCTINSATAGLDRIISLWREKYFQGKIHPPPAAATWAMLLEFHPKRAYFFLLTTNNSRQNRAYFSLLTTK